MDKRRVTVADLEVNCESPLAELVHIACQFQSKIMLKVRNGEYNAKSIMGIISMNLESGMVLEIEAHGKDETKAASAVEHFLKGHYQKEVSF